MNNSFYDRDNQTTYIVPAPRQLSQDECKLAVQLALESFAETALANHLERNPEPEEGDHEVLKEAIRSKRVAQLRGRTVMIRSEFTDAPGIANQ